MSHSMGPIIRQSVKQKQLPNPCKGKYETTSVLGVNIVNTSSYHHADKCGITVLNTSLYFIDII